MPMLKHQKNQIELSNLGVILAAGGYFYFFGIWRLEFSSFAIRHPGFAISIS
jgi:hypothetical protein